MKKTMKRVLASLLCLVMIITAIPLGGLAGVDFGKLFSMKASAATITSYKQGDIIEFGWYPQSEVTDSSIISELNSLAGDNKSWTSYGYYSGTGNYADGQMKPGDYMRYKDVVYGSNKYRGVVFETYRPGVTGAVTTSSTYDYYSQASNGYYTGIIYWFKYEPVKWRVLDPATGMVMSETVLDSQAYNNYILCNGSDEDGYGIYWGDSSITYYANNYVKSSIREWLNKDFYNTAFSTAQHNIIEYTELDNSAFDAAYSIYDSETTYDKIYLLSWDDILNLDYGFDSENYDIVQVSEYSKCQGLGIEQTDTPCWWLRTPSHSSCYACFACRYGYNGADDVDGTYLGVRPALNFNLTAEIVQSDVNDTGNASEDEDNAYYVTYCDDNGNVILELEVVAGHTIIVPEAPTKEGYEFVGWFDGNGNEIPETMPAKDMVFYAKFIKKAEGKLTVEIVPERTYYDYINGVLSDASGETFDTVNVSVYITNNLTDQKIENITIDFSLTGGGGFGFFKMYNDNNEDKYKYSITIDSLPSSEKKEVNLILTDYQNSTSVSNITADVKINEEFYDSFESEKIYLNYKINIYDEVYGFKNIPEHFIGKEEKNKYLISSEAMKKVALADKPYIYLNSQQNWGGSCYGMSAMLAAFEHGWSSTSDYGAPTVKELSAPIDNIKLRDAINIMQSSQSTLRFIQETFYPEVPSYKPDVYSKQVSLRKKLVDEVKDISNGGNVVVLNIKEQGAFGGVHSVVAYDIVDVLDKYYISIADPNQPTVQGFVILRKDCSNFSYDLESKYTEIKSVITDQNILDINSYLSESLTTSAVEEKYDFTYMTLSDFDEVNIENKIGQKAIISYVNGTVEGDLDVYVSGIAGAKTGTVSVVIPDNADEINEYKITSSNGMTATINNNHVIADLKTTNNATVNYSSGGFVSLTGLNDNEYSLSLTDGTNIESTEMLLNTVFGNNADIVEMKLVDNEIEISSDNLSDSKLTVVKNDDELTEESYDFEEDNVVVESKDGEITVGKNENNNDNDDDNDVVPPVVNVVATIRTPSTTTINYGDSIWLHAEISGNLPTDTKIIWTPSNNNFEIVEVSADGLSCKVTPVSSGTTTFTVSVVDTNENVLSTDTQDMTSKAGLWQKIVAFFKKLFGLTKTYPEFYNSLF